MSNEITIGRLHGNSVVIKDEKVSRNHCRIIQDDYGNYTLIDNNSKNGTFVNGQRRQGEVRLKANDIIRVGNTTLPWQSYFSGGGGYGGGATVGTVGGGGYVGGGGGFFDPPQSKPNSFLVWSILATVFCCQPFGIAAIVQSTKVDNLWAQGDYAGSVEAARKARTWFWWSFACGIVFGSIGLVIWIVVAFV